LTEPDSTRRKPEPDAAEPGFVIVSSAAAHSIEKPAARAMASGSLLILRA
jgi:hypothetical protein